MEGLEMNSEFWKDKKVLVTGHTGFKGGWIALWLQQVGADVTGFALPPPTQPSLFTLARVENGMRSIIGDVRDFEKLQSVIERCRPQIIIHMAAQSLVRQSYADPVTTYATNVMGTVNMLEVVRRAESVKVVVNITSDKCYENREWMWGYRENDSIGGYDPYSSSKGCAELVTATYQNIFSSSSGNQVALASARAGNVIGGGDWSTDRLIPDMVKAFMAGQPVMIRSPQAVRPWQHVLEPLNGYLVLAEKLWAMNKKFAGAWNFGPRDDDCQPVSWVVDQLAKQWGNGARWELDANVHPHEANFLKLDCTKAKTNLGWTPKLTLREALIHTIDWYRAYCAKDDMRVKTLEQITEYQRLLTA